MSTLVRPLPSPSPSGNQTQWRCGASIKGIDWPSSSTDTVTPAPTGQSRLVVPKPFILPNSLSKRPRNAYSNTDLEWSSVPMTRAQWCWMLMNNTLILALPWANEVLLMHPIPIMTQNIIWHTWPRFSNSETNMNVMPCYNLIGCTGNINVSTNLKAATAETITVQAPAPTIVRALASARPHLASQKNTSCLRNIMVNTHSVICVNSSTSSVHQCLIYAHQVMCPTTGQYVTEIPLMVPLVPAQPCKWSGILGGMKKLSQNIVWYPMINCRCFKSPWFSHLETYSSEPGSSDLATLKLILQSQAAVFTSCAYADTPTNHITLMTLLFRLRCS